MQKLKNRYQNDDIANDVTMLEEVPFISFLSCYILYGPVVVSWVADESRDVVQSFLLYYSTTYSGLAKVNDLIRYSEATNLAFIEHTSIIISILIYIVMHILLKLYYL